MSPSLPYFLEIDLPSTHPSLLPYWLLFFPKFFIALLSCCWIYASTFWRYLYSIYGALVHFVKIILLLGSCIASPVIAWGISLEASSSRGANPVWNSDHFSANAVGPHVSSSYIHTAPPYWYPLGFSSFWRGGREIFDSTAEDRGCLSKDNSPRHSDGSGSTLSPLTSPSSHNSGFSSWEAKPSSVTRILHIVGRRHLC